MKTIDDLARTLIVSGGFQLYSKESAGKELTTQSDSLHVLGGMYSSRQVNINIGSQRPPQDKYERFEAWLKDNGAQFDLVSRHFNAFLSCSE